MKNPWYFVPRSRLKDTVKRYQLFTFSNHNFKGNLNHNFSLIQMNSSFIELVNKDYVWKGKMLTFSMLIGIPYFILISIIFILIIDNRIDEGFYILLGGFFLVLICSMYMLMMMLCPYISYDFLKKNYSPIIINRKTQTLSFYDVNDKLIELNFIDIYFDFFKNQGIAGLPIFELHAYKLEGDTIIEDIQIGAPSFFKDNVEGLLGFIKTYVEHGPEPLFFRDGIDEPEVDGLRKLTYCYDIHDKKESFKQSWETVYVNHFQTPLLSIFFAIPELIRFIGRRITLIFAKKTVWNNELKQKNVIDENDPYIVTAENNLKFGFMKVKKK